jgi:hypothetical protein
MGRTSKKSATPMKKTGRKSGSSKKDAGKSKAACQSNTIPLMFQKMFARRQEMVASEDAADDCVIVDEVVVAAAGQCEAAVLMPPPPSPSPFVRRVDKENVASTAGAEFSTPKKDVPSPQRKNDVSSGHGSAASHRSDSSSTVATPPFIISRDPFACDVSLDGQYNMFVYLFIFSCIMLLSNARFI